MQFKTLTLIAIASQASASIVSEVAAASSQIAVVSSVCSNYDLSQGLGKAYLMQGAFDSFAQSLSALSSAGSSANLGDLKEASVELINFYAQSVKTLDVLSRRAADFIEAGAGYAIRYNIDSVGQLSHDANGLLISIGQGNCAVLNSFSDVVSSFSSGYSAAAVAYGGTDPSIPKYTCSTQLCL